MWRFGASEVAVLVVCAACGSGSQHGSGSGSDSGTHSGGTSASGGSGPVDAGGARSSGTDASSSGSVAGFGGSAGTIGAGAASASGGTNGVDGGAGAGGTSGAGGAGVGGSGGAIGGTSKKLDLLLVVDNSISMADKQAVLRRTVPDLVQQLTDTALGLEDLHVGVITSSLGGYGTTLCKGADGASLESEEVDDHGHLVGTRPRGASIGLPGGFATWTRSSETPTLVTNVQNLVAAAGEFGCGFEATLEAAYRFLADPNPPLTIETRPCTAASTQLCAFPTGRDDELLTERQAFLRPDSAVAVVVLSDENDCSIRATSQFYYAARDDIRLPRGSAVCATDPNDPCCYSCAGSVPAGCTADPICQNTALPPGDADPLNLRCFEQKRRFGIDMLYPVGRYANALRQTTLCVSRADLDPSATCPDADASGAPDIVRNPLFPDPSGASGPVRDPSMVYLLGVVGVPWQTIRATTDPSGSPLPAGVLRYRTGAELVTTGAWPVVLGDPSASPPAAPKDPLMVESVDPRTGTTPGTGEALASPSAGYLANSINGHEWTNSIRDDLQYACILQLDAVRDCTQIEKLTPTPGCDCGSLLRPGDNNPLCQKSDGSYGTIQYFAKGYPGLRHLALVKALGDNATVASICSRNITDDTLPDYGYRPAVDVLVTGLRRSVR